jgi:hypothetical protein
MEMLGAITGLIGAGLSASAQANAQSIQMQQLMFQKQQAAKQERMSQAARMDAYGNSQYYDPLTNKWVVKLTPTQKQITTAGEGEQLRSLTEDAQRKRQLARRQEQRSLQAESPYNEAIQHYMYDKPPSEDSIRGELETLMAGANQDQAKKQQDTLARQALRLGRGADIPRLIKATDDNLGQAINSMMLQARTGARDEAASRRQQHDQTYLPEIARFQQLIDDGGGQSEQRFSNVPQQLDAIQGQQASQMAQAIQAATSGVASAYNGLATAAGKSPDLSGLTKAFSGGGKSSATKTSGKANYSLTNTSSPWDDSIDWGSAPDYLNNVDYGRDYLF